MDRYSGCPPKSSSCSCSCSSSIFERCTCCEAQGGKQILEGRCFRRRLDQRKGASPPKIEHEHEHEHEGHTHQNSIPLRAGTPLSK
jgi:hypothetical protein